MRRWLKRYVAEGVAGLQDCHVQEQPPVVTEAYVGRLIATVRRRPRRLELPFSREHGDRSSFGKNEEGVT